MTFCTCCIWPYATRESDRCKIWVRVDSSRWISFIYCFISGWLVILLFVESVRHYTYGGFYANKKRIEDHIFQHTDCADNPIWIIPFMHYLPLFSIWKVKVTSIWALYMRVVYSGIKPAEKVTRIAFSLLQATPCIRVNNASLYYFNITF